MIPRAAYPDWGFRAFCRLAVLPLAFCLVLAAMIALELAGLFRDEQNVTVSSSRIAVTMTGRTGPATPTSEQQQWAIATLARPLFAPDRRPRAAAKVAARAPAVLPRLTGVLIYGDNRRAFFAGVDGAKAGPTSEGAEVADFRIQKIEAGQVVLLGADGVRVVRPTFDPRTAAGLAGLSEIPGGGTNVSVVQNIMARTSAGSPRASAR